MRTKEPELQFLIPLYTDCNDPIAVCQEDPGNRGSGKGFKKPDRVSFHGCSPVLGKQGDFIRAGTENQPDRILVAGSLENHLAYIFVWRTGRMEEGSLQNGI